MIDLRISLARPELAPVACEGVDRAQAYGKLRRVQAIKPLVALLAAPDPAAEQVSQLLFGEAFDLLREDGGYAWGQARRDGYVGWVEIASLGATAEPPTHRVRARHAGIVVRPEIRAPAAGVLGLNALCRVTGESGAFSEIVGLGWAPTALLAPLGQGFGAPSDTAVTLLGAPYVWGGRDTSGLDCSGLVQQCLFAAGHACPRDADQQAALGTEIAAEALAAGDLVAWRGHIGLMIDSERLIHANAHHMAVAIEPLSTAIARIRDAGSGEPTAYRRLTPGKSAH